MHTQVSSCQQKVKNIKSWRVLGRPQSWSIRLLTPQSNTESFTPDSSSLVLIAWCWWADSIHVTYVFGEMMSCFKLAWQWYKIWNQNFYRPSHECHPTVWRERKGRGGGLVLECVGLNSSRIQDRHKVLKPVGVQDGFTNTQPIRKCFEKHLSLMGWDGNSGEASMTKERDYGRIAMPLGWKGSAFRKRHASHSKHTARRPPVHSGWPRRNDDDVLKGWPSNHSMPLGLKQTSWFTPLPGLLQTRLSRANFYISHPANTLLAIRTGLCQILWNV